LHQGGFEHQKSEVAEVPSIFSAKRPKSRNWSPRS